MNANDRIVRGPDGVYGTVDLTCWGLDRRPDLEIDLRLVDGRHVTLAGDSLIEQSDGTYYLPLHRADLDALPSRQPSGGESWPCDAAIRRSISSRSSER